MSLNAIATPAAREPGPLVTRCRSRTVAKVDSIGLVVLSGSAGAAHVIVHRHELIARSSGQRVDGPSSRVDLRLMRK
jgi:hypothetical protein